MRLYAMVLLGAHMSIAGGYYKAVQAAAGLGMDVVQLFTKNNNQWKAKPIEDQDVQLFRQAQQTTGVDLAVAHDSYLINLAASGKELYEKSLAAYTHELERAEWLGLMGVVMHPGSHVGQGEQKGLHRIARALNRAHQKTKNLATLTLLETTAGQGTNLGYRFEQLADIIARMDAPERVGVCLDTCHVFAAGYDIVSRKGYLATLREFDSAIGLDRLRVLHLNDSKRPLGSRVDRHEHIGRGHIGLDGFRHFMNDRRLRKVPMCLETPKGQENGQELDAINLNTLRGLVKGSTTAPLGS